MANQRISIIGLKLSVRQFTEIFTRVTGKTYHPNQVSTFASVEADKQTEQSASKAFNDYIASQIAKGTFEAGFTAPHLVDTVTRYGWRPETVENATDRLLPAFLQSQGFA